ncbi:hypothetical protein M0K77_002397 [Providencia rettgeri]
MNVYTKEPTVESSSTKFGFYPKYLDIKTNFFSVITIPEYESVISDIKAHPNVDKDWFYAGPQEVSDLYGNVSTKPYSGRVFSMPKTHILKLNGAFSQKDLNFVIWCLSFFTGMRLTTTQAGFLDATPIKPGTLVDFCVSDSSEQNAIQVALNYLRKENHHHLECTRIAAVIHALFLAQRPQNLNYEKFQYLYMSLDGCVKNLKCSPHFGLMVKTVLPPSEMIISMKQSSLITQSDSLHMEQRGHVQNTVIFFYKLKH